MNKIIISRTEMYRIRSNNISVFLLQFCMHIISNYIWIFLLLVFQHIKNIVPLLIFLISNDIIVCSSFFRNDTMQKFLNY